LNTGLHVFILIKITDYSSSALPGKFQEVELDHVGQIFRPPSEAQSLLLQVTLGCSHNKCTYCAMYDDPQQNFMVKPFQTVARDIDEAAGYAARGLKISRVFLCDGDALIMPTAKLQRILQYLREKIPTVRRVGIYGDARSILRKGPDDLALLKDLGLGIVYHGVESGDDDVLAKIQKGSTAAEAAQSAKLLKDAGIRHSVIVMLGIGGIDHSTAHAEKTADLLTLMDPPFVGALTTTIVPGTPLYAAQKSGHFTLPEPWQMLEELRTLIRNTRFSRCRFHSNHASNYLPLSLNLPADREKALMQLDKVLSDRNNDDLRPEYWRGL
jgi:radical SAM superfamily enzyme YgiQ (UPF0313 family)